MHSKGAYFARGSGHNQYGGYTEDARDYQIVVDRLRKKWLTAARLVPTALIERDERCDVAIVSLGSCDGAVREARAQLATRGIATNYLRVRGFPFGEEVETFLQSHRIVFVVEQNRDAQLRSLLILETAVDKERLRSILHYNGLPIPASYVTEGGGGRDRSRAPRRPARRLRSLHVLHVQAQGHPPAAAAERPRSDAAAITRAPIPHCARAVGTIPSRPR